MPPRRAKRFGAGSRSCTRPGSTTGCRAREAASSRSRREASKEQPWLVTLTVRVIPHRSGSCSTRALDPTGGTSIDWYVPSPDGELVAVSLSRGGTERGDVHVYEMATGKQVGRGRARA